jgi:hypothetical protein
MNTQPINSGGVIQTTDATPTTTAQFEVNPDSSMLGTVRVVARVPSTGAVKCWFFRTLIKCVSGNTSIAANADFTPPLASAADAFFNSGFVCGVTCTGLAGTTIDWWVDMLFQEFTA